ncbi:MAG: hypothetical protein HY689_07885 [Chloroflexi bacterium]|nr:hypothetical protein [Chloroflexota bacterium]
MNHHTHARRLPPPVGLGIVIAVLALVLGYPSGLLAPQRVQAGVVAQPATGAATGTWSGSIVIQNNGTEVANAVVNFYSTAGVLVKSYPLPTAIPPKGSAVVDTDAIVDLPNGFAGSAIISAAQPVSAIYLAFDSGNPAIGRGIYAGMSTGTTKVYVPAISHNYADQTSVLAVQNVDAGPVSVTIRYYDRFTGALTATVSANIPPGASQYFDASQLPGPQQLPPPWSGAAVVEASGRITAAVHQPYLSANKVVNFEATASAGTEVYLPSALFQYAPQQQTSFIAVQNTQATPVTATVSFYDRAGNPVGQVGGTIDGFRKLSWNPGSAGLPSGYSGVAVVRASGPVVAIVNIGSATDLALAYTGQPLGSLRVALPYVRWAPPTDPKGWRTYIAIMNVDQNAAADLTLRYYDTNGTLVHTQAITGVVPYAKGNHHPGLVVGTGGTFVGSVEVESTRPVVAVVNAITADETLAESFTGIPIP